MEGVVEVVAVVSGGVVVTSGSTETEMKVL